MKKILTQPPAGMRDFLASDMIKREYVISKIKTIFERFEVLQGKYGEEEKLIYKFKDLGGRELALRYDLTVPLARVVARFPNLPKPIRRYQISRVWRYERKQRGRYKEFWQCDVDIVGSKSMLADAEIIAIIYEVLKELGFKEFTIRINNRKILTALTKWAGVEEKKSLGVLRSIDKLDKKGLEGVKEELKERGIDKKSIKKILEFISIKGKPEEALSKIENYIKDFKEGKEGIEELKQLFSYLRIFGIDEKFYELDLSLARGLDYYTGPIYETVVKKPNIGSITGGGRYDKLIGIFSGIEIPATGTSFGIERIIEIMDKLKMFRLPKTRTKVFVANAKEEVREEAIRITQMLRRKGINCQMDVSGRSLKKQLEYADSLGIDYVVIVAPKELKEGKVILKDMKNRKEETIRKEKLIQNLR